MTTTAGMDIIDLDDALARLSNGQRSLFERIFQVSVTYGRLSPPDSMLPWLREHFGRIETTTVQKIVRVTNRVTLEGAHYNWLRSSRPLHRDSDFDLDAALAESGPDSLAEPYENTPEDVFGRVEGRFCVTASNVAKADGYHALIVFGEPHPLRFTREMVHDYVKVGAAWAQRAHETEPAARYYFFLWNCLWRAGASQARGHAQVMLGRDMHYAAVEDLRRSALMYQAQNRSNYFDDVFRAEGYVGAAFERRGVRVLASLTPVREKEVVLMAPAVDAELVDATYDVLACLRDKLGVVSFNLAVYSPPLASTPESWEGFPCIVRIVDRGDPASRTSDVGAMELFGASVVASDPLKLARVLADTLQTG